MKFCKIGIIRLLIWWLFLFCGYSVHAQGLGSPYSVYGLGDMDYRSYNRTGGMAGVGLALYSDKSLILNNPASLTKLDRSFFYFDLFTNGKIVNYSGKPITLGDQKSNDIGMQAVTMGIKLNDHWATAVGFRKISTIDFLLEGTKYIEGSLLQVPISYKGEGGLNEFSWNNSFLVHKNISLGIKTSAVIGSRTVLENFTANNDIFFETKIQDFYSDIRIEIGGIYSNKINQYWSYQFGAKFIPKVYLLPQRLVDIRQDDTLLSRKQSIGTSSFNLPMTIGLGAALKHRSGATIALDYFYEDWQATNKNGEQYEYINSHRIHTGVEFAKIEKFRNLEFERKYFQVGAYFNSGHLQLRNYPIKEYGITIGGGGYFKNSLPYHLSVDLGIRGTTNNNLIREQYFQVNLGLMYKTFFQSKGRRYD